jgi:hypothetical protein
MVKLNIAGTTSVGVPKTMVFVDDKGKGHIYPSLTAKNHISSHYGIPSIGLKNKAGNTVSTSKIGGYVDSSDPLIINAVKKARVKTEKAQKIIIQGVQEIQQAQQNIENAVKKRGRPKLTEEQKAKNKQMRKGKKKANLTAKISSNNMANDTVNNLFTSSLSSLPKPKKNRKKHANNSSTGN